ncbi:MAG: hypothetical protein ACFUZC_20895 [Chthoniobacteraceae bacterium]
MLSFLPKYFVAATMLVADSFAMAADTVVPLPAIPGVPQSTTLSLKVNGREVPVNYEKNFDFQTAAFCLSGTASVEIAFNGPVPNCTVHPLRHKITPVVKGQSVSFSFAGPLKLVVQMEGQLPLALIATPPEQDVPSQADSKVIYFTPGVHDAGVIRPQSGQTVYFAPGALVKGRIEAKDASNVTVKGRGILDSGRYSVRKDKTPGILFERCSNVVVEGIGHRGGTWWQSLYLASRDVRVSNMNLLGKTVNTDGIDIDGVKNFTARDCFIRSEDDGFGWHALDARANGELTTEDALAENCVVWNTGAGNGLRIGASMESPLFQNITFRNIDILKHAGAAIRSDHSDWAWCKNIRFENFTDETPAKTVEIVIAKTRYSNDNGYKDERGHFDGLHFVKLVSPGGAIDLRGADADHLIDNVTFEDCVTGGVPLTSLQQITVNSFVKNVSFKIPQAQ